MEPDIDTTWKYDTEMQSHINYVSANFMQLVHALLILLLLICAELCFALLAL